MSGRPLRVVIVGAGVGGLTLALLLRRRGVTAEVLEQAPELREVGAAVALAANGTRVLREVGLVDALERVSFEPTELIHRRGVDGHRITAHPVAGWYRDRFGAPFLGVHRVHLQLLLGEAWGPEHLHLGWRVTDIEQRDGAVRVRGADGREVDADVVVGADGVHSVVRSWVTGGDSAAYSGTSGFRGLVPVGQLTALPDPGAIQFWVGPGAHLLHYPIGDGSVINFLAVVEGPARWTSPVWMTDAEPGEHLAPFAGWHPAVTQMIDAAPQGPRWGLFSRPPLHRWNRGAVILLGDAAHAMLPHHGQGANQTIEDAAVLAAELAECGAEDVPGALDRYTARRRGRTRQVQLASWATSPALHLPDDSPALRQRDSRLARLPEDLAWMHGHDALATEGQPTAVTTARG
ncbi:FAD-dependent monooxygenase [Pseudonocardia bannensis]|uniref:NAD(P)-binding protein n=1 Tax=Pseudonocardia bannensis TaxID=630973 RepID=A0A848DF15_9PSEU|nr:FAD-dependent monooxygenase [Pseudonocardia bannensis]NMH91176.1 NAD(P)-binding protein [Pseudonocardia bannensis]